VLDVAFAVPGDLSSPTGGYAYARKLLGLAPDHGVNLIHLELPGGFPQPSAEDLAETKRRLASAAAPLLLVDGLAYGALPADLVRGLPSKKIVALVHHPLGFESGLAAQRRAELLASERDALTAAMRVIASSFFTARLLASDFAVPPEKIDVAEPGTEPAPRARGTGDPVALLAVGAVSPRKGYEVLVRALGELPDLDWRLTIAGSLDRDPQAAASLRRAVADAGLDGRVVLAGAVGEDELERLYDAADAFVSPSLFEGYGMVLAEAMARGLPVVASTGGAAAETVPDAAALKVPPGDVPALRDALRDMIADPGLRRARADASWAAGQALPRWPDTAAKVAAVLKGVAAQEAAR
jgi:glycosyltransferase involved in cell wall biosynthesis